jgi:transcriptional regulator with XRE-family HTH domain
VSNFGHTLCTNGLDFGERSDDYFFMDSRSRNLRTYLQEELVLRCKKNAAYSLRSFAKAIDVSPSFLSKILNGKRRITPSVAHDLMINLNLNSDDFDQVLEKRETAKSETHFNALEFEYFKVISDWYHYAIIELTLIEGFSSSPEWISERLGITTNQTKSAIDRLIALGLLKKNGNILSPSSNGNTTTKNNFTAMAFKKMQNDLLEKAIYSLWNEELENRDHTSICMAISTDDLPEVKKRLTQFRRELCNFLERPKKKKPNRVFNLNLAFFALSKELK